MTSLPQAGMPGPLATQPQASPSGSLKSLLPAPLQALLLEQKKQAWVGWVDNEFTRIKNQRSAYERQWQLNLAFYAGKHYISPVNVAGVGFKLVAPKAPPWRVRLVINKIRTAVRTEASKLTSSKPMPMVIPATTEDEDYSAARVAEQILKSEFNTAAFNKIIRSWVWWGVCTGNSYLKSYWDATETDSHSPDIQGCIKIERVNPFQVYVPDLLVEDIEEQPFIIHVITKSPLWVKKAFGINVSPDTRASSSIMESAILTPVGASNQGLDAVLIKEVWLKPGAHPDFPQGGILTICGDKVVQFRDVWPLPFKEFPFYKYDGMPTGAFYTESVVTDLIPIQKEYNRTKSQMIEIKNTMGKPKLLYQKGSVNPRQISSEPGQGIPYVAGMERPTVLPAAEVPQTMQIELDRLTSDFDDVSGQHEITRGNNPAQVTSGTAINFLQEQDDTKLSYQVSGIEAAIEKLGVHYLKYASTYWVEERLVRIVGRDNDFEAKHWKGSDLRGNTDVRIQSGSALPVSKAAKQALIQELMMNQWIDPQVGMEVMELGGLDKILEDFLTDKRSAQRENMRQAEMIEEQVAQLVIPPMDPESGQPLFMDDGVTPMDLNGQPWQPQSPIPVNSWDNHEAHIHFHNQFRKSQQFELLGEAVKQAFELHVQTHQMAVAPQIPLMGQAGMLPQEGQGTDPEEEAAAQQQQPQQ